MTSGDNASALPVTIEELTPAWLTDALGVRTPGLVVEDVETTQVIWGTATKALLRVRYREHLEQGPPEQLCVKGAFDPALLELGMAFAYQAEVDFYKRLAPNLSIPAARCWYAEGNPTQQQGIVILEDLAASGHVFGEPTEPFTTDQVAYGLEILAGLHAATAGANRKSHPWVAPNSPVRYVADIFFTADYWDAHFGGPDGPPVPKELADRTAVIEGFRQLWALEDRSPKAISHGDPHIGNTYIDRAGRPVFLDWQGVCAAPPMDDVAYLVSGALTVEDRRAHERDLLDHYREAVVAAGGDAGSADDVWLRYRQEQLHGFLWSLTGPKMQPRERVFAMSERHVAAIEDHETLGLLAD